MKCLLCETGKVKGEKIYEDDQVVAVLAPQHTTEGHVIVFPKNHYPIFDQVPDQELEYFFNLVNKLSVAIFEAAGASGTNIIIQNGVAAGQQFHHFAVHIIPRKEEDGLNFLWESKQLNEEEMSTAELKLKDASSSLGSFNKKKNEPIKIEKKVEKIKEKNGENYLTKQLERIP